MQVFPYQFLVIKKIVNNNMKDVLFKNINLIRSSNKDSIL